jgi:hypothetical protein
MSLWRQLYSSICSAIIHLPFSGISVKPNLYWASLLIIWMEVIGGGQNKIDGCEQRAY